MKTKSILPLKTSHELVFSPSEKYVACVGGRDISMWDLTNRKILFAVHPIGVPSHVNFSPDGGHIAVKNTVGRIVILNAQTGSVVSDFKNQKEGEGCPAFFSRCGRYVISASWDGILTIRDWQSTKTCYSHDFGGGTFALAASADRRDFFIAVTRDPVAPSPEPVTSFAVKKWPFEDSRWRTLPVTTGELNGMNVSPSGRYLCFSTLRPYNISVYDTTLNRNVADRSGEYRCNGFSVSFSPNQKALIANGDGRCLVYSLPKLKELAQIPLPYSCFVQFSPTGRYVALGSWKKGMIVEYDRIVNFET